MNKQDFAVGLLFLLAGLSLGNFIYQFLGHQNWHLAAERSFFQFIALFAVWIVFK